MNTSAPNSVIEESVKLREESRRLRERLREIIDESRAERENRYNGNNGRRQWTESGRNCPKV